MNPTSDQLWRLQLVLRIGGAMMVAFFTGASIAVLLNITPLIDESAGTLGSLLAWSETEGYEYVLMLSVIYIVWGAFVWRAANDPLANRSMIEFTILGNFAHLGLMGVMAIADPKHIAHLWGDVPFGLILPIALLIVWRPFHRAELSNA